MICATHYNPNVTIEPRPLFKFYVEYSANIWCVILYTQLMNRNVCVCISSIKGQ